MERVDNSYLTHIITQLTREYNVLDLVLNTVTCLVCDCEVSERLSSGDHYMIRLNVGGKHKLKDSKSKLPDYRNDNFDIARELLSPKTALKTRS